MHSRLRIICLAQTRVSSVSMWIASSTQGDMVGISSITFLPQESYLALFARETTKASDTNSLATTIHQSWQAGCGKRNCEAPAVDMLD